MININGDDGEPHRRFAAVRWCDLHNKGLPEVGTLFSAPERTAVEEQWRVGFPDDYRCSRKLFDLYLPAVLLGPSLIVALHLT